MNNPSNSVFKSFVIHKIHIHPKNFQKIRKKISQKETIRKIRKFLKNFEKPKKFEKIRKNKKKSEKIQKIEV